MDSGYFEINITMKNGQTDTISPVKNISFDYEKKSFSVFNGIYDYEFLLNDVEDWKVEVAE